MHQVLVGRWRFKNWCICFLFSQLIVAALLIYPAAGLFWLSSSSPSGKIFKIDTPVYTFSDSDYFDPDSFQGTLVHCSSGCKYSYSTEQSQWCSIYNTYYTYPMSPSVASYRSLCSLFTALSSAAAMYSVFLAGSVTGVAMWACLLCNSHTQRCCFKLNYCCPVCTVVTYLIAFVSWNLITIASYQGNCRQFPSDGSLPQVCANAGPKVSIAIVIVISIFSIVFLVVFCMATRKLRGGAGNNNRNRNPVHENVQARPSLPRENSHLDIVYSQRYGSIDQFNPWSLDSMYRVQNNIPNIEDLTPGNMINLPYAVPEMYVLPNNENVYIPPYDIGRENKTREGDSEDNRPVMRHIQIVPDIKPHGEELMVIDEEECEGKPKGDAHDVSRGSSSSDS